MQVLSTSPLVKTYTLEEFWKLPEPKNGSKYELIAGVLYMTPPPNFDHNSSSATLTRLFILHLAAIGDAGVVFTPRAALWTDANTYVEPDLFYLSAGTFRQVDPEHINTADLVVEVISSSTAIYDRNTKADTYAALRVKELWLVDPQTKTVEVRNLKGRSKTYGAGVFFKQGENVVSQVLPKFSPPVSEVCKRLKK
jgi:Uma2 family endonuclease